MKNQLISSNIHSICQDSLGFIWIATEEGLSIFDSKTFNSFTTIEGLSDNNIQFITADKFKKGTIWFCYSNKGLDKYSNGKFVHFLSKLPAGMQTINTIYQDSDSIIWCGTNESFFVIKNDSIKTFNNVGMISVVRAFAEDTSGNILISGNNGLFVFDKKKNKLYKDETLPSSLSKMITSIYIELNGSTWFITEDGELINRNEGHIRYASIGKNRKFISIVSSPDLDFIYVISDKGLFKVNKSNLKVSETLNEKNGLPGSNIRCAMIDREGILWLGFNDEGISKLVYPNLYKFPLNKYYTTTAIDNNSHIWISTGTGLREFWIDKNNSWQIFNHPVSAVPKQLLNTYLGNYNNTLILTLSGGTILEYSIINTAPLSESASQLHLNNVINIPEEYKYAGLYKSIIDSHGNIWTSALDLGVIVLNKNGKVIKIYSDKEGMPDNSVRCIFEDSHGNFWFGGYNNGLAFFSKDKILKDFGLSYNPSNVSQKLFKTNSGLPDNSIREITEDSFNNIIIGTRYGGMAIYKNGIMKKISRSDGLISNGIWDVADGGESGVWIATQSGIQRLDKNFKPSYQLNEEVTNNPFYSITIKNKVMAFASNAELYVYDFKQPRKRIAPSIYFTQILVNGKQFPLTAGETLTNEQNNITFDFIGIDNIEEENISYNYRMLNIDKTWQTLQDKNSVTYASLKPGKYTFQVNAVNSDNISSTTPASINFIINQPFYLEWWFLAGITFLALLAFYSLLNIKNKRRLEIERIRMKIAEDLHDEIGSGLTKIAILSENALKEQEEISQADNPKDLFKRSNSITRVGKISRDLVDHLIDVIWSIDPKYDTLTDFVFSFKNFAYEMCEAKNIELNIKTNNIDDIKVNSQIKRNLILIAKESLNNAIKYSGCTKIIFTIIMENRNLIITIEDNGKGFDKKNIKAGNGLSNIEKRILELSGEYDLTSVIGKGTKIYFKFPVRN